MIQPQRAGYRYLVCVPPTHPTPPRTLCVVVVQAGSLKQFLLFIISVHILLLTPVLLYIWLSHTICHICQTWHIRHIWRKRHNDIHHMALYKYGVMGVKRTVAVHYPKLIIQIFVGVKTDKSLLHIFSFIFSRIFLCIFKMLGGNNKWCWKTRYILFLGPNT